MPKMTERWRKMVAEIPPGEFEDEVRAELSRAAEVVDEMEAVLERFKKARRFDDEGRYCGWRISGPASVNEAMVFVDAILAHLNEEAG